MIKVFFADGGTLEQLRTNLRSIADTADARLSELGTKADELASGGAPFSAWVHLNALGLRFVIDHERAISSWAGWALEQTATWRSTSDPGGWDHRQALRSGTAESTSTDDTVTFNR